jgi:glycosyltransferase involved in cell wall biosynthesis
MPTVYNALDLAVSSSRWGEGFPNVVAEAMAAGVPCLVTNVGDSRNVVGDTGWVCPPHDPAEFAKALMSATESRGDLAERGRRARERVIAEFSIDRLTSVTSLRLQELLSPTG